jgi:ATP-dependent DNA helicase PIF1
MSLSPEQTYALQSFENGNNLFITGPGGTGKTFLIQHLIKNALERKKIIQVCALTGCASLLLNCNARTIHSWSGIYMMNTTDDVIVRRIALDVETSTLANSNIT